MNYMYFVLCLNFTQVFPQFGIKFIYLQIFNLQVKRSTIEYKT